MSNKYYRRSADCERQLVNQERSQGHVAYRTPGSKGASDVIVLDHGRIKLIQVKTGGTSAWVGFGPKDRERLLDEAKRAGGYAELHWFPAGPANGFAYSEDKWPK